MPDLSNEQLILQLKKRAKMMVLSIKWKEGDKEPEVFKEGSPEQVELMAMVLLEELRKGAQTSRISKCKTLAELLVEMVKTLKDPDAK